MPNETANEVFKQVESQMEVFRQETEGNTAIVFDYTDPVDGSISKNQGYIFRWTNGSRFIFRKSGTGSSGATIRIYLESYDKDHSKELKESLKDIAAKALAVSRIQEITGMEKPTVIT